MLSVLSHQCLLSGVKRYLFALLYPKSCSAMIEPQNSTALGLNPGILQHWDWTPKFCIEGIEPNGNTNTLPWGPAPPHSPPSTLYCAFVIGKAGKLLILSSDWRAQLRSRDCFSSQTSWLSSWVTVYEGILTNNILYCYIALGFVTCTQGQKPSKNDDAESPLNQHLETKSAA